MANPGKKSPPRTSTKARKTPSVELKIDGSGVTLATVHPRELAELLIAAAATIEGISKDIGESLPAIALTSLRSGSAAYKLTAVDSDESAFLAVLSELQLDLAQPLRMSEKRQRLMRRLSAAASGKNLTVSIDTGEASGRPKTLPVPPPSSYILGRVVCTAQAYGEIAGVSRTTEGYRVRFKIEDGETITLSASKELTREASKLFDTTVQIDASYDWNMSDRFENWTLEGVRPWAPVDPVKVFDDIADAVGKLGPIDVGATVSELNRDS